MLALYFRLGRDAYALDTARVQEIVPVASTKALPGTPPFIAGLLNYRGQTVPVIDLPRLVIDRPFRQVFGSRILIVRYRHRQDAHSHLLGLIVEEVSRTERVDASKFRASGVRNERAPYLKDVAPTDAGIVQLVEPNDLLPDEVHRLLFQKA